MLRETRMKRSTLGALIGAGLLFGAIGAALGAAKPPANAMTQCSKFHFTRPDVQPTAADLGQCASPFAAAIAGKQ